LPDVGSLQLKESVFPKNISETKTKYFVLKNNTTLLKKQNMHKCVNEVFNKTKPNKDLTHSFEISSQTSRPLVDCPTQLTLISHLWIFLFVRTNIKATNMKEIQQGNLLADHHLDHNFNSNATAFHH